MSGEGLDFCPDETNFENFHLKMGHVKTIYFVNPCFSLLSEPKKAAEHIYNKISQLVVLILEDTVIVKTLDAITIF